MKTVKINFKEVTLKDLEGNELHLPETFAKDFGNINYTTARDIDVADLSRKVFESHKHAKDLDFDIEELNLMLEIFDNFKILGYPAHNATKEYLINKLETLNK